MSVWKKSPPTVWAGRYFMPSEWAKKQRPEVEDGKRRRKPRMTKKKQGSLAAEFRATFMHFVAK